MRSFRAVYAISIVSGICLLGGCVNHAALAQCRAENWYERGYQDGSDGLGSRQFLAYHELCTRVGITPHRTDYLTGWAAGNRAADAT
jgi:hypothetical protein